MLKSKLEKFIAKRAAILAAAIAAADLVFGGGRKWVLLLGFLAGAVFNMFLFCGNGWILKKIAQPGSTRNAIGGAALFSIFQLILFPAAVLAYCVSIWVLYGFAAGVLVIPLVIMINSMTEAFGITKNNFE